jgi:D-alanyl-D-alanine dipeptidase
VTSAVPALAALALASLAAAPAAPALAAAAPAAPPAAGTASPTPGPAAGATAPLPPAAAAPAAGDEAASPPLVDVAPLVPDAVLDLRYATARNVTGRALYPAARCLLLLPAAERLAAVARRLRADGYRLVLWDCYRPASAHAALWAAHPRPGAVADPARGSHHSRGTAVDASLADLSGAPLAMPTDHDAFGPRAHADATEGVPEDVRRRRDRLRAAMEAEGFVPYAREWWHFAARDSSRHPIRDEALR